MRSLNVNRNSWICPYCGEPLIEQEIRIESSDVGLPPAFKAMMRKGYAIMLQCLNCYQNSTIKTPKANWFLVFPNGTLWEYAQVTSAYEWRKVKYKLKTAHIMY